MALKGWFDGLSPLEQDLILRHLCALRPLSLAHLAHAHSRPVAVVQQAHDQLRHSLEDTVLLDSVTLGLVTALDDELLVPSELETMVARHFWLGATISDRYDITALHVLIGLRWRNARTGPWLFDGDIRTCISMTLEALDLEPLQIMSIEAARHCLARAGAPVPLHAPQLERWLAHCGLGLQQTPEGWIVRSPEPDAVPAELREEAVDSESCERTLYFAPSLLDALTSLARVLHSEHERAASITLGELLNTADAVEGELGQLARSIRDAVTTEAVTWTLGTGARRAAQLLHASEPAGSPHDALEEPATAHDGSDSTRTQWLRSLQEDVRAVLLAARAPLTAPEIAGRLDRRVRLRTLRDLLAKDEEIISAAYDSWALALLPPDQPAPRRRAHSQLDKAVDVLANVGGPLSTVDLKERSGLDIQPTYLKQKLDADPRFRRAAKDLWALSEWGMPVYKPMKELVGDLIDQNDGAADVNYVIRRLVKDFGVKEPSLRQVMSTPPFSVRNGQVHRLADVPEEQASTPVSDDHSAPDQHDAPSVDDLIEDLGLI
ncbi:hypothetical protein [Kitasatospora sp. NPDC101183]|uniref:hypothetical protein n=1 Tax=Kitasatospora sp. NPDC101183 TaxID=3364100 RepID=UPI00381B77BD